MGRKYFGTDGVRGRVGQDAPITPDFVMRLGYAAGAALVAREACGPTNGRRC
jgi:phosphoglucosamine mutase